MNYMEPYIEAIKKYEQANLNLESARQFLYSEKTKEAMQAFRSALNTCTITAIDRNREERKLLLRIEAEALGQLGITRSYGDE